MFQSSFEWFELCIIDFVFLFSFLLHSCTFVLISVHHIGSEREGDKQRETETQRERGWSWKVLFQMFASMSYSTVVCCNVLSNSHHGNCNGGHGGTELKFK